MNGRWICVKECPQETTLYEFTKTFSAEKGAKLKIKLCADSRYQLLVNNNLVAEGPCQGSSYVRYYDSEDCGQYLVDGNNDITVKVLYLSKDEFISVYRGNCPAMWLEAELSNEDTVFELCSDKNWECVRDDSIKFIRDRRYQNTVPQFEHWHSCKVLTPVNIEEWYVPKLSSSGWDAWGVCEYYPLDLRPIPQMETKPKVPLTVIKSGKGYIELDAGKYVTAKVSYTMRGEIGKTVKIIYGECYHSLDPEGHVTKGLRDNSENGVLDGPYDLVDTNGSEQIFSPFWYRAFRYIRIEYSGDFDLLEAHYSEHHYPLHVTGSFVSSDEQLNQIWNVSINTLQCCMQETYMDCPHYEQLQYVMDSALEALYTYRLSQDMRLPQKSLTDMAHSQRPDGMLQSSYPSQLVQVIPSFSLFWILMLKDYLLYSGNKEFARQMTGTMDKILEGFRSFLDERGLVGNTPYWHFVDWVPGWDRGVPTGGNKDALTVYSLMYAAALHAAADVCEKCGRGELAREYAARSAVINDCVKRHCYDEVAGLFRDTPSGKGYSEHTSVWAILSGAVSGQDAVQLMERTLQKNVAKCSFAMSYYLFRALEETGLYQFAYQRFDGWRKMLVDWHCTTWCENPDSPRSECHGWSSVPIYEFSAMILGVKPNADGWESVIIKPYTADLENAQGTVPTPRGHISVSWQKEKSKLILNCHVPSGISTTVVLDTGEIYHCSDADIHIESDLKN